MKALLSFNIETRITMFIHDYSKELKLFFLLFFINILIYGQKLFFTVLAPDDYYWFFEPTIHESASWLGRWMETIFNQKIFTSPNLHILPYMHGIFGVFIITLSGYLTGKILNIEKNYELVIITLLISATPYFAHLLYFNLILSAWIGILLSIIGLHFLYKPSIILKLFGFIIIVMAIGTYQAILQVIIAIIMIKTLQRIVNTLNTKQLIQATWYSLVMVMLICLAFIISGLINNLYLEYYNLASSGNYAKAGNISDLSIYIDRIKQMYYFKPAFYYFNNIYYILFTLLFYLSLIGALVSTIVSKSDKLAKFIATIFILILFAAIPIIVNLPLITGTYLPIRSQFVIGWLTVGAFVIFRNYFKGIFRSSLEIIIYYLIAANIYYITIFYYAGQRQTNADIINANQIVTQIRLDKNYVSEPINFKIVGLKNFSVEGWPENLQAFGTDWSHYWIFKHFTNFTFNYMNDIDYKDLETRLIKKGEMLHAYPSKNSTVIYKNNVILFLDVSDINKKISFNRLRENKPDIKANFNLYLDKKMLYYYKPLCTPEETKHTFFLHIYAVNLDDIPTEQKKYGFQNLDFEFSNIGNIENNSSCMVAIELPLYNIKSIKTGQYHKKIIDWEATYNFSSKDNYKAQTIR